MPLTSSLLLMALIALVAALAGAAICYEVVCRRTARGNEQTVRQQKAELQAMTRRIIRLQEDERSALSRELHDDIGQAITAIKLCAQALDDEDDARRGATVAEISDIADQTVIKLRNLSLLLRPPQLDALGLESALRWQAGTLFRNNAPELVLSLQPLPQRPAPGVELACFRIAQEALTNVIRHANASRVEVALAIAGDVLELRVEDNGAGFDPRRTQGLGLVTMRERAEQLGGTLEMRRGSHGGTCVCARLPMAPAATKVDS
ncbi:ATP-binding protein [Lysobacter sp. F60174L2]|uniref:ATP-binding protein n=1 Tax=Lysobacter sp. F60174L2 TaxID=3459295 RepID=UPI00403DA1CE